MIPQGFEMNLMGKRILITGRTGFIGQWVQLWLNELGAFTYGLSLKQQIQNQLAKSINPPSDSEFFGDVANRHTCFDFVSRIQPDLVLHLAAQPIVSEAYTDPYTTLTSNVQGTSTILAACANVKSVKTIVCVTTDKVYKNQGKTVSFQEADEIWGNDPYSSSKAATENVIASFAQALAFQGRKLDIHVARCGNAVGGGDYSINRIVPDLVLGILENKTVKVRNLNSIRPWQHVLSLVHGLLLLLSLQNNSRINRYEAWNFGPNSGEANCVSEIIEIFKNYWKSPEIEIVKSSFFEQNRLELNSNKALQELSWESKWNFKQNMFETIDWYRQVHLENAYTRQISLNQILKYRKSIFN